jgi:hypothetical protein
MKMGFYVYRKFYFPQARNRWEALDFLREAEEKGVSKDYFVSQWAKEEKTGWIETIKKQLKGK